MGLDVQLGKITDPFPEFADKQGKRARSRSGRGCAACAWHDTMCWRGRQGGLSGPLPVQSWCSQSLAILYLTLTCVVSLTRERGCESGHLPELAPAGPVCLMERKGDVADIDRFRGEGASRTCTQSLDAGGLGVKKSLFSDDPFPLRLRIAGVATSPPRRSPTWPHSTPANHMFTSMDFNSYVTVYTAQGVPHRVEGRMWASRDLGSGGIIRGWMFSASLRSWSLDLLC